MKWVAVVAIVAVFLFHQAVLVASAIYDPSTGRKLPDEGGWERVLFDLVLWFLLM